MKLKSLIGLVAGVAMTGAAFAQTNTTSTSSTDLGSLYSKLKESPASLSLYSEIGAERNELDNTDFNGFSNTNILTAGWKFNAKNSMNAGIRWDFTKLQNEKGHNNYTNTTVNYYRNSLLTEEKNGVSATLHLRHRQWNGLDSRGYNRAGIIFGKSLTDKLSVSVPTYVAVYTRKNGNDGNSVSYFYAPTSMTYSFTDKASLSLVGEYFRNFKKGVDASNYDTESFDLTLDGSYSVNKQLTLGASAAVAGFMKSHDGRTLKKDMDNAISYGAYASIKAF